MRVLFDTNILISSLLSPDKPGVIQTIVATIFRHSFTFLLPTEVADEFARTVIRKKSLAKRVTVGHMEAAVTLLFAFSKIVPSVQHIPIVTRDAKDDYLLAYAKVGKADYLVTGDEDLLVLGSYEQIMIITPATFLLVLRDKGLL